MTFGGDGTFTVSHVRSGKEIPPFGLDRRAAYRLARELLRLTNWDRPPEKLLRFEKRVLTILEDFRP